VFVEETMDLLVAFPVSGVKTWLFLPPLVAFAVSFVCSMGGISGAFLLLPFQISFLHFVTPSVSATNFVYNIVAVPSGVYRYIRERRMVWPLAWTIALGTLPGVLLGYYIRVLYLPDPDKFRLFVGCVLLYIGIRLLREVRRRFHLTGFRAPESGLREPPPVEATDANGWGRPALRPDSKVAILSCASGLVVYEFCGERHSFKIFNGLVLAFVVGIVGGAYGIGGGAIIAPFCVAIFRLPIYTVAGASLFGTCITSIAGIAFYSMIPAQAGLSTSPDWALGILFGLGGMPGMYCGARVQKFVPQTLIKAALGLMLVSLAACYILKFFG